MRSELRLTLTLLLPIMFLHACVTPAVRRAEPEPETEIWRAETLAYEELFDPLELEEPAWSIDTPELLLNAQVDPEELVQPRDSVILGYRVQIAATPDLTEAQSIQERALLLLGEAGVYYEYDPPLYRIRVGNCPDRKSARRLQQRARAVGFTKAWIVQSRITLKTPD